MSLASTTWADIPSSSDYKKPEVIPLPVVQKSAEFQNAIKEKQQWIDEQTSQTKQELIDFRQALETSENTHDQIFALVLKSLPENAAIFTESGSLNMFAQQHMGLLHNSLNAWRLQNKGWKVIYGCFYIPVYT